MIQIGSKLFEGILSLDDYSFVNLTIENPKCYYDFVTQCCISENRFLIFSSGGSLLPVTEVADIVTDLFSLSFSDKKIENLLQRKIARIYEISHKEDELSHILSSIYSFFDSLSSDLSINLEYNDELGIKDVLKILSPSVKVDCISKSELFIKYMKLVNEIKGFEVFVFVNLKSIFEQKEFECLMKEIEYEKFKIINVEPNRTSISCLNELNILIDSDLCQIMP